MIVQTFDEFCIARGTSAQVPGDAGMHKTSRHVSGAAKRRAIRRLLGEQDAWDAERAALREAYDAAVAAGEIRPPTRREALERKAQGHSNRPDVQAARRILARLEQKGAGHDESPAG